MELVQMLDLSWTTGETVHLLSSDAAAAKAVGAAKPDSDDTYLVTYKAEFGMSQLMSMDSGGKALPSELKLALVKLSSISSITPAPDVTKERLVKAMASASALSSTKTEYAVEDGMPATAGEPGRPATAEQAATLSNGKQLALGMIMYCTDYDDLMPYVQSVVTVKEVISPYLKNMELWKTNNPASQWHMNMSISGVQMVAIPEPAATPLFYESAPWPDGRRVVTFCDGHVQLVGKDAWAGMAKYLKLKLPRAAKKPLPLHVQGLDVRSAGPPPSIK
jgi:prepilin-type processing-associated H-X9-DG protein